MTTMLEIIYHRKMRIIFRYCTTRFFNFAFLKKRKTDVLSIVASYLECSVDYIASIIDLSMVRVHTSISIITDACSDLAPYIARDKNIQKSMLYS